MSHVTARQIVRALSPEGRRGIVAMLQCYFDDSGTHDGSQVVVWGGVFGYARQFAALERRWSDLLQDPCEGYKPPIKSYHSSSCAAGVKEFAGYSPGERDRTRYLFRNCLTSAKLHCEGSGIETEPYNRIMKGRARMVQGDPNTAAFTRCISLAIHYAEQTPDRNATAVFDLGQRAHISSNLLDRAEYYAKDRGVFVQFAFSSVEKIVGLQAADVVATESYWHLLQVIRSGSKDPKPHLARLIEGTSINIGFMREKDVRGLRGRLATRAAIGRAPAR